MCDLKKRSLLLKGKSRETAAEERDLYGFQTAVLLCRQPCLYDVVCIFRCHIVLSGCDDLLIAEDTVVGTAAMWDEDGNNRMCFHKRILLHYHSYIHYLPLLLED